MSSIRMPANGRDDESTAAVAIQRRIKCLEPLARSWDLASLAKAKKGSAEVDAIVITEVEIIESPCRYS